MGRPGPCIKIQKTTSNKYEMANTGFIIPMDQEFSISTTQELQEPLAKAFTYLQEAVIGVSGDQGKSTGATVARTLLELSNLFGFQIGSKGYHSKAWAGALPSNISVTAKLYRGMTGEWNSVNEVFIPARQLYALTLPYESEIADGVASPIPSPAGVFASYSAGLVTDAINSAVSLGKDVKSAVTSFFSGDTWSIDFGFLDKGKNDINSFLQLQRYVVESSTIKFGSVLEKSKEGGFFPTTAEVTLAFVSEDFLTSANFGTAEQRKTFAGKNSTGNK